MSYKQNCTKGPVREYAGHISSAVEKRNYGNHHNARLHDRSIATVTDVSGEKEINKANASLIAEAFNTLHETGMTPRELAEHKGLLIAALKDLMESFACRCGEMENPEWTRSYDYAEKLVQACERGDEMPVLKTT